MTAPHGLQRELNQPHCPQCDNVSLRRQGRVGFLQRAVLPMLGLYPWECGLCRRIYLLRQRSRGYVATPQVEPDAESSTAGESVMRQIPPAASGHTLPNHRPSIR